MAGSWERTKFDNGEYEQYIKESTGPLLYRLDPNKFYNCKECRPKQPGYIGTGVSISRKNTLVDVESELRNITRPIARDPKKKYLPCKKPVSLHDLPACDIITDETRLTNPACNLRGTGVSQHIFFNLCQNPQDLQTIEHPGRILINDKQLAKDNHKPILPTPVSIQPSLPSGNVVIKKPLCCPMGDLKIECVYTDPLNKYYENLNQHPVHIQKALEYNYQKIMDYHNKL